jgi:predicted RNA-binding protein with TRAM domain
VYYIKIRPYSSSASGTYQIAFNTGSTPPLPSVSATATQLTANTWANGDIPTSSGEQWFKFTATAATQYIHATFGTLTALDVQLYDSAGTEVGSQTYLSGSTKSTSKTVTSAQVYYIKVRASSSSGTYQIAFNTSIVPPGVSVIPLTASTWANGDIPTANGEQWFLFTATAATQYIHATFGTLTALYVQLYDSTGATVGSQSLLYSTTYTSKTVTNTQVYYIKIRPYSSSYTGTYEIAFNTGSTAPPPSSAIPLTLSTWANGTIATTGGEQWFKFTATAGTQYLHASFGTLTELYVQLYDRTGATVGTQTRLYSSTKYVSKSVTSGVVYYIKVTPYSGSDSGTYQIAFNTNSTAPLPAGFATARTLTANIWGLGNIATAGGEQWFKFTATAATQYIHASFGSLNDLYVQVYNSSGTTVGSQSNLYSSTTSASKTVTNGQVYYIKVWPYASSGSGTYQRAFNTGSTAPDQPTMLTFNTWANGTIASSSGEQWFKFTATAATQYIHASFGTLTDLYVQLYYSTGATVGSQSNLFASGTTYTSKTVTNGQVYYIKVTPFSGSDSGTYQIAFNTSSTPPIPAGFATATQLTFNTWASGNIASAGGEQWFKFTATATTQYIHASFGTLTDLYVQVYDSTGATVPSQSYLSSSTTYISRTVTNTQMYYIRIWPSSSSGSGNYQIKFNTSSTP